MKTFTVDDLAERWNISRTWIYDRASRREIPHLRFGRAIRFTPEHVEAIERELEQRPQLAQPVAAFGLSPRSRHRRGRRDNH